MNWVAGVFCMMVGQGAAAAPEPVLRLDQQQSGDEFSLRVTERLTVELVSDQRRGLRWDLLEPPISVVMRQIGGVESAQASSKKPGPAAALLIQRWTFEGVGKGHQRLRFELRRPGEAKYEAEDSVSFLIQVKPR